MNNKITVVILKPKKERIKKDIVLNWTNCDYIEKTFDLRVIDYDEHINIYNPLSKCNNYDVILLYRLDKSILDKLQYCDIIKTIEVSEIDDNTGQLVINKFYEYNYNYTSYSLSNDMFSIITPTYNTPNEFISRAYNSLVNQTYKNWEWYILDDSTNDDTVNYLLSLNDSRIRIIKNITNKGNVGYNKNILGMSAHGSYILELDHDDELTSDCLEYLIKAFKTYEDAGFVYSNCLELDSNGPVDYGEGWGYGEGKRYYENNDIIMDTPSISDKSIRSIMSAPNHVRCWRKDVYISLLGHNYNLSVIDDLDLLIRTFLFTKIVKVQKVLYIQHREHETTQNTRNKEIQRLNYIIKHMYDERIHNRIVELGGKDLIWDDNKNESNLYKTLESFITYNYLYE